MKTNKKRTGENWRKADARVLGQILAAQNIEFALPDTIHIAEFFAETLITIPGIIACRVCLEDVTAQKGEMELGICAECQASRKKVDGQNEPPSNGPNFKCGLTDQPGIQSIAIDSLQHHFGYFVFQIGDPETFNIYKPFIGNLANYVAISLENRRQKDLLQKAHNELERRVEERTEELRASNETIKDLYNNAPCGYHSIDKDGFFVHINDTELRWLGYSREEIVGKIKFQDLLTANSLKTFEANFPGFKERGWVSDSEFELVRKDGTSLPVLLNATAITDSDGNFVMSRSTIFDITEHKRAEEVLQRLNRELRAISNCNQVLVRAQDEQTLLNDICRIICDEAGYRLAWVGYVEHDEAKTVRPAAWGGFDDEYVANAKLSWADDTERGRGPGGTVIRSGETIYIQDFTIDPRMAPWRESALQHGYHSAIGLPLKGETANVFGVLLIYSTEINSFTPDEIRLLEELAGDLAFGIGVLRARSERNQAEEALRQSEELLRVTLTNILDPVFITDNDGKFTFICPNVPSTLGYSVEEIQALGNISKLVGDDLFNLEELEMRGEVINIEHLMVDNFGRQRIFLVNVKRVSIKEGTHLYALHDITKRKQAEQALRESEERLRQIASSLREVIWLRDAQTRQVLYVNPAFQKLTGRTCESFYENRDVVIDAVHPDDNEGVTKALDQRSESAYYNKEHRIIHLDGSVHWVSSQSFPVQNEAGEVYRWATIMEDITERKQAEEALRESETKFRAVFENSVDAIGVSKVGIHTFANPAYLALFGYADNAELSGKPILDLIAPSHRAQILENVGHRASGQAAPAFYETRGLRKDGSEFDIDVHVSTYELNGEIYTVPIIRDITERKQTEQNLRQMNERFSLAARAAHLGVWDWDLQKDELVWDDGMYALYGVKREDFTGAYDAWLKGIHPDDRAPSDEISKQAQRGEREYDTEFRVVWPDGSIHYLKAYGQFVRDVDGKPLRMTGVNFDITERKQAEETLRTTKILLEQTFEQSPVPMVLVSMPDVIIRYVNPASRRFLGIEDEPDLINISLMDLKPSWQDFDLQGKQGFLEELPLVRSLNGIKTEGEERCILRKDGTLRYELVSGAPIFDDTGQIIAGYLIMVDITKHKQAENALRESERRYRDIFDNVLDGLYLLDVTEDGRFRTTEVNPALERLTGIPRSFSVGKTQEETVPAEVAAIVNAKYRHCVEAGLPIEEEVELDLPVGRRYFHSTLIPARDETGRVSRIIGISHDVTERKQAEQERLAHLRFFECMDQINRTIQGTNDLEQMLSDVLDIVLPIFDSDRAFLMYPCDPEATSWWSPMERTKPEYPGVRALGQELPMGPEVVETLRILLASDGPVQFGPGALHPLPINVPDRFSIKCFMAMVLYPKVGDPWQFGIHQCSHARIWTVEEEKLFQEIGRRLSDALTSLLTFRDLQESEQRYRQLFENMQEGFMIQDIVEDDAGKPVDVRYIEINPAIERFLGKPRAEIVGRTRNQVLGIPDPAVIEANSRVVATGQPFHMVQYSSGAKKWYESFSYAFSPGQVATLVLDITERKRAEEALHQSEERFRRLAENARDVIYRMSIPDGNYEYVSPAALAVFGYSPEECYQAPMLIKQAIHPAWQMYFEEQWANLIKGEMPPTYEYQFIHKSRKVCWLNQRNILVRDDAGIPIAIEGIVTDITERKRAEMELSRERELLRTLVDNMPEEVYVKDRERRFLLVNELVVHALSAQSIDEVIGKRDEDFLPPDLAKQFADEEDEIMRTGKPLLDDENTPPFKSGPDRWYMRTKVPLRDGAGNIIGLAGLGSDITERKRAEEKIRKLNQELEQRVLERTAQLEAANKELEAFAYSVSHDLRAPLRHIDGFLELLQERTTTLLDEKSQHYMANISEAARRMGLLIDDLLSFSRMGRNEMSKAQVDLGELVQDVIQELRPDTESRDIQWKISPLPMVAGDRAMLKIVLVNLIANALKFTRARSPTKIEIGWRPGQEKEIVVFVRDNGVGFDMQYANKLFGVFQRLHRADEFEGTGIGLANVRRVINRHGGRTWAEGEIDHGATFYFSLPQFQKGDIK